MRPGRRVWLGHGLWGGQRLPAGSNQFLHLFTREIRATQSRDAAEYLAKAAQGGKLCHPVGQLTPGDESPQRLVMRPKQ